MPTFQFDEYRLHAYDENGNPIQLTPEVVSQYLQDDFEKRFNNLPPLEVPPDQVWTLSDKASRNLVKIVKKAQDDHERYMTKCWRMIRHCHRLQERVRRERLKGAPMERIWDIQLRHTAIIGELIKLVQEHKGQPVTYVTDLKPEDIKTLFKEG